MFPFSLRFHPTGKVSTPDDYAGHDLWVDLMAVPNGSTLYEVWAMDKPAELGGVETHIADVNLLTQLTTSQWGDKHFFIRHQKMDTDLESHPEWVPYTEKFRIFGAGKPVCTYAKGQEAAGAGCPYAKMFLQ